MKSPTFPSDTGRATSSELFELELELPDKRLTDIAAGLIGFAERHNKMQAMLRLLLDHDGLESWSKKHMVSVSHLLTSYPIAIH